MDIRNLKRDSALSQIGTWTRDIPGMGKLELKTRGINSDAYQAAISRLGRAAPPEDRERDNSLKPHVAARISGEAAAEALLLDWKGLKDGDNDVPYSAETAMQWLPDPDYKPFLDAVIYAASIVENGRASVEDALAGN
ncbi:hypothetical protein [Tianweitania sp.]|uniref:hypothetical protein n=1 Tax=Tianweitania sp. TaxID=2021634 RepID=UPI0028969BE4|nr:hypothetical protein [Tianweitania sp.]